eukprot:2176217-Heterocapsa_arctica.AAC.1
MLCESLVDVYERKRAGRLYLKAAASRLEPLTACEPPALVGYSTPRRAASSGVILFVVVVSM